MYFLEKNYLKKIGDLFFIKKIIDEKYLFITFIKKMQKIVNFYFKKFLLKKKTTLKK